MCCAAISLCFSHVFVQFNTGHTCSTSKICEHCDSMKSQASVWLQLNMLSCSKDVSCRLITRLSHTLLWLLSHCQQAAGFCALASTAEQRAIDTNLVMIDIHDPILALCKIIRCIIVRYAHVYLQVCCQFATTIHYERHFRALHCQTLHQSCKICRLLCSHMLAIQKGHTPETRYLKQL